MADLKTTIAQTENLKNKVKLAKDRINETVVRGGGITSKSLSEIPDNINKMLRDNYKKVAIMKYESHGIDIINKNEINWNLSFTPKLIVIEVINGGYTESIRHYPDLDAYYPTTNIIFNFGSAPAPTFEVLEMTKDKFRWRAERNSVDSYGTYYIKSIIAIE